MSRIMLPSVVFSSDAHVCFFTFVVTYCTVRGKHVSRIVVIEQLQSYESFNVKRHEHIN